MPHILIAIDGTNSYVYRRRWVEHFHNQASADHKRYWPGPTDLGGATGLDCDAIHESAISWLNTVLRRYGASLRSCSALDIQLTLVGHSRGGHTVVNLCNQLPFPVNFLALYDAVDMTAALGDTSVIRNARFTAHARRSPHMDSWSWWGNTGTSASTGLYEERYFETNHGGVGGDVGENAYSIAGDTACVYQPPAAEVTRCYRGECYEVPTHAVGRYAYELHPDIHSRCGVGSDLANQWIRERAIARGIRFTH
jgi:hypothetical protein